MIALVRLSNGYKQQVNISSKNMCMCSQPSPIKSSGVLKMCICFRMSVQLPGVLSKQIPHLHSLRFSSYLGNHPVREQRWKNLTSLCGQQHGWGCGGMCRGFQRHLKNTLLTARSLSSNPKLLIFGAVWCLTQGPVVRKFAIAGEEYQRQGARIIF